MSGTTISISSEHVIERPALIVRQTGERFDVLLTQEHDRNLHQTVWLTGSIPQLSAACERLAKEISDLAERYPILAERSDVA